MVVEVLITNCQVSEKPKKGPSAAHTVINKTAHTKAAGFPMADATLRAIILKCSFIFKSSE